MLNQKKKKKTGGETKHNLEKKWKSASWWTQQGLGLNFCFYLLNCIYIIYPHIVYLDPVEYIYQIAKHKQNYQEEVQC